MKKSFLVCLFATILIFSGCEKDDPAPTGKVEIIPRALFNGEPIQQGFLYDDGVGHKIRIDDFKAYLSDIALVKETGERVLVADYYLSKFYQNPGISAEVESTNYTKIQWSVGVPEAVNKDSDPAEYANTHPLSVTGSAGMFWSWNTGYIFTKFDGKANLTGGPGPVLDPFAFHIGEDFLYRSHEAEVRMCPGGDETQRVYIDFHVDQFLA
ncbi:MAG: MbnP family protein, partial [Bacteroidota bacterium]